VIEEQHFTEESLIRKFPMSTPASDRVSLKPATANPTDSYHTRYELPDKPLVTVQASNSWTAFDFKELWAHRELLYFLTLRDIKVRYKQTIFGIAWVLLQPAVMTLIFTVFLGMLVRVPTSGLPYPILVYSGLLPWTFFSSAVLGAGQSLVSNASLITKVYFPRVLIPTASIAGRLLDFAISFLILVALIFFYRFVLHYPINLTWKLLAFPPLVLLLVLLALGLAMLVSSLNVKYRDVGVALPVLMQLWMFVTPIVYPAELVPEKWRMIYSLNPLVGLIQGFRAALFGTDLPVFALAVSVIATVILLLVALLVFRHTEKTFADVV
jgi:lipopolysaccharide transport system permease protein